MSDSLTYTLLVLTYLGRPCTGRGGEEKNKKGEKDKEGEEEGKREVEKKGENKNIFSLAYTLYLLTIYI